MDLDHKLIEPFQNTLDLFISWQIISRETSKPESHGTNPVLYTRDGKVDRIGLCFFGYDKDLLISIGRTPVRVTDDKLEMIAKTPIGYEIDETHEPYMKATLTRIGDQKV